LRTEADPHRCLLCILRLPPNLQETVPWRYLANLEYPPRHGCVKAEAGLSPCFATAPFGLRSEHGCAGLKQKGGAGPPDAAPFRQMPEQT